MKIIDRNGRIIEKKVGDFLYFKHKDIDSGGEWIKCTIEDIFEYINSDDCLLDYKMRINPEEYKKIIKKSSLFVGSQVEEIIEPRERTIKPFNNPAIGDFVKILNKVGSS